MDCIKYGAPNKSKQYDCPASGKKWAKCGKSGHFAKCCRTGRRINHNGRTNKQRGRRRLYSRQNTVTTLKSPFTKNSQQERTTVLPYLSIGQQSTNKTQT